VHHRVKNNMAMVSAFINLQMKQVNEESSLGALKACENRIQAMSMVHKRLYQSSDFTSIDMKILFNEISGALYKKSELADIEVSIETNGISLEMDTAIPCALIVNELFSNSLKYAFRNKQPGKIDIHMDEVANELYRIRISDNGVGFTKSIRLETADTLGLQLVNVFVGQLSGEVKIYGECGIAFEIVFPVGKKTSV